MRENGREPSEIPTAPATQPEYLRKVTTLAIREGRAGSSESKLLDPHLETSPTIVHSMSYLDLKETGPLIVHTPPGVIGMFRAFTSARSPT